jgi:hypothetical protein
MWQGTTTARAATSAAAVEHERPTACLVLVSTGSPRRWALLRWRRRHGWLARLRHRSLDVRLAAGEPPETSRLLAVRTAQLTSPSSRGRTARRWDAVAADARQRLGWRHVDVAEQMQQVADVLRGDRPVGVRGVAVAMTMAGVAAHGLRRSGCGGCDIAAAVARSAISAM